MYKHGFLAIFILFSITCAHATRVLYIGESHDSDNAIQFFSNNAEILRTKGYDCLGLEMLHSTRLEHLNRHQYYNSLTPEKLYDYFLQDWGYRVDKYVDIAWTAYTAGLHLIPLELPRNLRPEETGPFPVPWYASKVFEARDVHMVNQIEQALMKSCRKIAVFIGKAHTNDEAQPSKLRQKKIESAIFLVD